MRTKINASDLRFPTGTFTQKDLSSFNGTTNQRIWGQMFELIADGTIKFAGYEKRAAKGKPAQVYVYVPNPADRVKCQERIVPSLQSKLTCQALIIRSAFWNMMGEPAPEMIPQPAV